MTHGESQLDFADYESRQHHRLCQFLREKQLERQFSIANTRTDGPLMPAITELREGCSGGKYPVLAAWQEDLAPISQHPTPCNFFTAASKTPQAVRNAFRSATRS